MNELQTSLTHYQVKKENGAITVLANKPICVCDHFWDCMNEEWVFLSLKVPLIRVHNSKREKIT